MQKFKTQDVVTRSELVDIIARQREAKLLEDNSQQFMDYCIDSLRETYNCSCCMKQSTASSGTHANHLINKRLDNRSTSLTGSFSAPTADFQQSVGTRLEKPEIMAMAAS